MKEYSIDGAYVQRFLEQIYDERNRRFTNKVLDNVRKSANSNGVSYTVMYDLSGPSLERYQFIKQDWQVLMNEWKITQDPVYQKHNGKPLVALWGIGFNDRHQNNVRGYLNTCLDLIQWFKDQGMSVLIGVPTYWSILNYSNI